MSSCYLSMLNACCRLLIPVISFVLFFGVESTFSASYYVAPDGSDIK